MTIERRIRRLLVPELDKATDKDLAIAHDGLDRQFAVEDVLERSTVGGEGVEIGSLRAGAGGEELRDPDRDVLSGGCGVSVGFKLERGSRSS